MWTGGAFQAVGTVPARPEVLLTTRSRGWGGLPGVGPHDRGQTGLWGCGEPREDVQLGEETSDQRLRKAVGSRVQAGSLTEAETPPSSRPWCTCPRCYGGPFWFPAPAAL